MSSYGEASNPAAFLYKYLGKTLRVHTTDKRVFVGQMKCTDRVRLFFPTSNGIVIYMLFVGM